MSNIVNIGGAKAGLVSEYTQNRNEYNSNK